MGVAQITRCGSINNSSSMIGAKKKIVLKIYSLSGTELSILCARSFTTVPTLQMWQNRPCYYNYSHPAGVEVEVLKVEDFLEMIH